MSETFVKHLDASAPRVYNISQFFICLKEEGTVMGAHYIQKVISPSELREAYPLKEELKQRKERRDIFH